MILEFYVLSVFFKGRAIPEIEKIKEPTKFGASWTAWVKALFLLFYNRPHYFKILPNIPSNETCTPTFEHALLCHPVNTLRQWVGALQLERVPDLCRVQSVQAPVLEQHIVAHQ